MKTREKVYKCFGCGKDVINDLSCEKCDKLGKREVTDKQWLLWLKAQRKRISNGLEFWAFDDITIGDKDTQASWGRCNRNANIWSKKFWLYPNTKPDRNNSVSQLIKTQKHHKCPFDNQQNKTELELMQGCFWRCRIFQEALQSRTEAVLLFDKGIVEFIDKHNSLKGK